MSFAKNMGKKIGKSINENLTGKYNQKSLDHTKKSAADALKTSSKRVIQITAEATDDLIGNKTADRITKVSKNSQLHNSEIVTNEHNKGIPKERYIYISRRKTGNY